MGAMAWPRDASSAEPQAELNRGFRRERIAATRSRARRGRVLLAAVAAAAAALACSWPLRQAGQRQQPGGCFVAGEAALGRSASRLTARPFFAKPTPFPTIELEEEEEEEVMGLEEALAQEAQEAKPLVQDLSDFERLPIGTWVNVTVSGVKEFGILVEAYPLNGGSSRRGLVHISEISDDFVRLEEMEKNYSLGQELSAQVVNVDMAQGRLSLSLKASGMDGNTGTKVEPPQRPNISSFLAVSKDTWLTGMVVKTKPFGVFVKVEPPDGGPAAVGLLHFKNVPGADRNFEKDEELKVRIESVEEESDRLSLTMMDDKAPCISSSFLSVSNDTWLTGKVVATLSFGTLVKVAHPDGGPGMTGLVHISQSLDRGRAFEKDEEVRVRVLSVLEKTNQISLTMLEKVDTDLVAKNAGRWFQGTVRYTSSTMSYYTLEVDLGMGSKVLGDLATSEALEPEPLTEGDKVRVRILAVQNDKVMFSMLDPEEETHSRKNITKFAGPTSRKLLDAKVQHLADYGVILEVAHPDGIHSYDALLHKTMMPPSMAQNLTSSFKLGQLLKVRIRNLDVKTGRMTLILPKVPEEEPGAKAEAKPIVDLEPELEPQSQSLEGLDDVSDPAVRGFLAKFQDKLSEHGYDSLPLLLQLNGKEWREMLEVCGVRPSDGVKLRLALGSLRRKEHEAAMSTILK